MSRPLHKEFFIPRKINKRDVIFFDKKKEEWYWLPNMIDVIARQKNYIDNVVLLFLVSSLVIGAIMYFTSSVLASVSAIFFSCLILRLMKTPPVSHYAFSSKIFTEYKIEIIDNESP